MTIYSIFAQNLLIKSSHLKIRINKIKYYKLFIYKCRLNDFSYLIEDINADYIPLM
jgi:hypothetical protein